MKTVKLAVSVGEPAGIGPDVLLQVMADVDCYVVAFADVEMLRARCRLLSLTVNIEVIDAPSKVSDFPIGTLCVMSVPLANEVVPGQLDVANVAGVLSALEQAANAVRAGELDALVTGPIHKGVINDAGVAFQGHTEFLAELGGGGAVVMMLANAQLRVALLTTHVALKEVAGLITCERLRQVIHVIDSDFKRCFGIEQPRILVCGLNPHAGEGGHLGREEIEVIEPALGQLRGEGYDVLGPVSADTAFTDRSLARCDVVLAMYHDQGLPVLKSQGFGGIVNVSLGLPFVRTSVDHGTALSLAGTGQAEGGSLLAAIELAKTMCQKG